MEHGFIRDMLDVKILILFVMNRVQYPVTAQQIYELCYQDDSLNYFDVQQAIPQMAESGHLRSLITGNYEITQKGRDDAEVTEDSVVYTLRKKAETAVSEFNQEQRRSHYIQTDVEEDGEHFYTTMSLNDDISNLMSIKLMAPSRKQAQKLAKAFQKNAESFYQTVMELILEDVEEME